MTSASHERALPEREPDRDDRLLDAAESDGPPIRRRPVRDDPVLDADEVLTALPLPRELLDGREHARPLLLRGERRIRHYAQLTSWDSRARTTTSSRRRAAARHV